MSRRDVIAAVDGGGEVTTRLLIRQVAAPKISRGSGEAGHYERLIIQNYNHRYLIF